MVDSSLQFSRAAHRGCLFGHTLAAPALPCGRHEKEAKLKGHFSGSYLPVVISQLQRCPLLFNCVLAVNVIPTSWYSVVIGMLSSGLYR